MYRENEKCRVVLTYTKPSSYQNKLVVYERRGKYYFKILLRYFPPTKEGEMTALRCYDSKCKELKLVKLKPLGDD